MTGPGGAAPVPIDIDTAVLTATVDYPVVEVRTRLVGLIDQPARALIPWSRPSRRSSGRRAPRIAAGLAMVAGPNTFGPLRLRRPCPWPCGNIGCVRIAAMTDCRCADAPPSPALDRRVPAREAGAARDAVPDYRVRYATRGSTMAEPIAIEAEPEPRASTGCTASPTPSGSAPGGAGCPVVEQPAMYGHAGSSYQILALHRRRSGAARRRHVLVVDQRRAHRPVHGRPHPRDERARAPHVPQPRRQGVPRVAARTVGRDARASRRSTGCSTRSRRSAAPISSRRSRRCTRCR